MSKEMWCFAYDEKYDQCIEDGMEHIEADAEAVEWANGVAERIQDWAEVKRKELRESK